MVTKEELVKIANRLYELSREEDVYGWMASGKGIQMRAATLRRLFPDVTFDEKRGEGLGEWTHLGTVWDGCEFFCLVTPGEYEKYKAPLDLPGQINAYAKKMDELTAEADAERREIGEQAEGIQEG
jgi:hypothetical protein